MAHDPQGPGNQVAPNMHGFDPLSKQAALALINGFTTLDPALQVDTTQDSFYLDAETLTELLQGERNTNGGFQGFRMMFGLGADNRLVLLINRVLIAEDVKNIRTFTYLPQVDTVLNRDNEQELYEYALLTMNVNGSTQLHRLDINGAEYLQLRMNFQQRFATVNPLTTFKISAKSILTFLELDPGNPLIYRLRPLITGYYIGWGTLELIRQEITNTQLGIRLFLGYGKHTSNASSANCLHLIAIAADSPQDAINGYPKPEVWSTQDQTETTRKAGRPVAEAPLGIYLRAAQLASPPGSSPVLTEPTFYAGTPGSSCVDATTETLP
jgi:hypothetical protein